MKSFSKGIAMAEPARKMATYEDLWDLPENQVGEILYGEIHTQPRPTSRHALALSTIGGELYSFRRGKGDSSGWWILDEPELHLDMNIMVPDLAGWEKQRMPQVPDTPWIDLVPDWVCEILSPSTAQKDRSLKMPLYAKYGVKHIWLVDPNIRTLEAYALQESQWVLLHTYSEDQIAPIPPFEAIEFPLSELWA